MAAWRPRRAGLTIPFVRQAGVVATAMPAASRRQCLLRHNRRNIILAAPVALWESSLKRRSLMSKMRQFYTSAVRMLAGIGIILLAMRAHAQPASEPPVIDQALLDELRHGGFVIYFRHAPTALSDVPEDAESISKCETQRNLSNAGRKTARDIGDAFRRLHIPVGEVRSSPFCRCKDTARLAFGKFTVDRNLYFALNIEADARRQLADAMRALLSNPPASGTNTILVSHTANLRESTGYWPKPEGTAYVFRPGPNGTFTAVARMAPGDWQLLANGRQRQ
jgi:broad specificity phosphatase PhoE